MSLILMTTLFYKALILSGEIWSWSLLGLKGLNKLTFFHADINQSEVVDNFQLASDWMKSVWKNVNKSKAVTLLGSLL